MYDTMFKLLDLTALNFSVPVATRNYKRIMSIVHPDKNDSEYAPGVSQAVNHAYHTLLDSSKRVHYMYHGVPAVNESFDESEAREMLARMRILLAGGSSPVRSDLVKEFPQATSIPSNDSQQLSGSRFEEFIKECQQAAASGSAAGSDEPVPSAHNSHHEPSSSHSFSKSSPGEPEVVDLTESDDETDEASKMSSADLRGSVPEADSAGAGSSDSSRPNSAESDAKISNQDSGHVSSGEPSSKRSESVKIYVDSSTSPVPKSFVDSSTSPLAKIFVDASTSPIKATYVNAATSPLHSTRKSSSLAGAAAGSNPTAPTGELNGAPGARRNLIFNNVGPRSAQSFPGSSDTPCQAPPAAASAPSGSGSSNSTGPPLSAQRPTEYIMSISAMRVRSKLGGAEFRVMWGPSGYVCTEKEEVVLKERTGLRSWLRRLRFEANRRYKSILRFHPRFKSVLTVEELRRDGISLDGRVEDQGGIGPFRQRSNSH